MPQKPVGPFVRRNYPTVSQAIPYIQRFVRQTDHLWYVHLTDTLEATVTIEAIGCQLPVAAIYEGVSVAGT